MGAAGAHQRPLALVAEAAAWCGSRVARRGDVGGRGVGRGWCLGRRDAGLEPHGGALRGREGDVGDVVWVVAAEQGQEGDGNVDGEEQADGDDAPFAVRGVSYEGGDGGAVSRVSVRVQGQGWVHGHARCIVQHLEAGGECVCKEGHGEETGVGDNGPDVALVKGGGVLAAGDFVELGVLPGAVGRVQLGRGRWRGRGGVRRRRGSGGERHGGCSAVAAG